MITVGSHLKIFEYRLSQKGDVCTQKIKSKTFSRTDRACESCDYSTEGHVKPQLCNIALDKPVICLLNNHKRCGILRFVGKTEFSVGVWYGIELNEPHGKNDGAVANLRYFQCKQRHGIFVNSKHIFPIESDGESFPTAKQVKRRVLPNVIQETSAPLADANNDHKSYDDISQLSNDENSLETRPRSKSDNWVRDERTNVNMFSDSPFRCDVVGKSSSLSKLSSETYIFNSPFSGSETNSLVCPKHSSPLVQSEESVRDMEVKLCPVTPTNDQKSNSPSGLRHHHIQLSPQLEVKQSIKLDRMTKLSVPLSCVKRPEYGLNKTFLVRKETSRPQKKGVENANNSETKMVKCNEKCKTNGEINNEETCLTSSSKENLNGTFVSVDQSSADISEARSRSASKSSWSSIESLSSVGSGKNNTGRSRLKSTNTLNGSSKKTPRMTDSSKSRLVKISAESKSRSKVLSTEETKTIRKSTIPTSAVKTAVTDSALRTKSRVKSTSNASGDYFDAPLNKKPPVAKLKSKSVSSEAAVLTKCPAATTSKLSTSLKMAGNSAPRTRLTSSTRATPKNGDPSSRKKTGVALTPQQGASQENNKIKSKVLSAQVKVTKTKQEENKTCVTRARIMSTPSASNIKSSGVKKSDGKSSIPRTTRSTANGLREFRKLTETSAVKKTASQELIKRKTLKNSDNLGSVTSCLNSAVTPDILKQTPEVTRHSIAVQVDGENFDNERQLLNELYNVEKKKVQSLSSILTQRNREFEATLVALQLYCQKVDVESNKAQKLKRCVDSTKEKILSAKKIIEKETNQRVRLEDEMLSIKSDSVVELALLGAEYERKQELMQTKLMDDHRKSLEKARKRNLKAMDEVKRSCDLKLKRVEETYVQDISQINENHKDVIADLETRHSKVVEELIEERNAEIDTTKADYEEQIEQIQNKLSESNGKCNKLAEKLKIEEEHSKTDIEHRIQDAIAKYKTLPAELESMTFVLEMKNNDIKKLRQNIAEYQNKIEELEAAKNRAAFLEREKESLHFVVENKVQFERKLSLERDKLRLSLDREVAASKRLSLENEELAWRLNTYHNSPTSPSFEKINWRMQSGYSSPDSAVFSRRIEESDLESQIDDTKETSN